MSAVTWDRSMHPLWIKFLTLLRGRPGTSPIRFPESISARTQPQPNLPVGPHHRISNVYYYTRDVRRLVEPPVVLTPEKLITAGCDQASGKIRLITPGKIPCPISE